jgi:nucleoside-diphosphate-sugar epimerase
MEPIPIDRHEEGVDILSPNLEDAIEYCGAVIHLAGVLGTAELFDDPEAAIDTNIKGTYRVLKACADHKMQYVGITMPQCWDNIYQATKLAAVKFAYAFHRHFDVPVSHVRAFNVFGEGQKVGTPQKIVPTFASRAWAGVDIPVWGSGQQLVDLVYVEDVARMLVDALRFGQCQTFDAGTASPKSVNATAEMIIQLASSRSQIEWLPMRKGEHGEGAVATGEGWELLGWRPQLFLTDLERVVESYRDAVIS